MQVSVPASEIDLNNFQRKRIGMCADANHIIVGERVGLEEHILLYGRIDRTVNSFAGKLAVAFESCPVLHRCLTVFKKAPAHLFRYGSAAVLNFHAHRLIGKGKYHSSMAVRNIEFKGMICEKRFSAF